MKPVRKSFEPKSLFPFQIVYQDTKTPQKELPIHIHDWFELVYVYGGSGTFFVDNSIQEMKKGDLFVLPGNTIHHAIPDKENPITSTAIFFNPVLVQHRNLGDAFSFLELFEKSLRLRNYRYSILEPQQTEVEDFLKDMHDEMLKKEVGFKHSVLLQLQMLLLTLNRSMVNQDEGDERINILPNWFKDVLDHIETHYTHEISLDSLASCGNVSTAHLSRVFKQMTGLNITEYIATKKILLAKDLLIKTDENIASIAEQCGFESIPHFYRTFKKFIGITPASYRKHGNVGQLLN
ncbi:AraC family transcriptional regulator [Bacillus solitudinis]|uniref:AraC family transcriptional regulator n=1 Tax=Bacillus solitudinis TaxID=2014074 RepID=UPI000C249A9B|nr:AraC family transcriptional regulator [Bacillus solitudinis]